MSLLTLALVSAATGVALALLYLRRRPRAGLFARSQGAGAPPPRHAATPERGPYAALSVRSSGRQCASVRAVAGVRFLETDAPTLPMRGCTNPDCQCHFEHHGDRRRVGKSERRLGFGLESELYKVTDHPERRRRHRGRRARDH